jgi:hypothetical protein
MVIKAVAQGKVVIDKTILWFFKDELSTGLSQGP